MAWWEVLRALPRATAHSIRATWLAALISLGSGLGVALVVRTVEHPWQETVVVTRAGSWLHILAGFASWSGKLENGLIVILLGWLAWGIAGRRYATQAAVITLLWAQLLAGICVNLGKSGLGRSRPSTPGVDGFYGPTLDYAFQSFPSGHTTAAFALGVALAALRPRWAPLALSYAVLVGWSRLALGVHHPSDVIMGAVLGSVVALICVHAGRQVGAIPGGARLQPQPK